MLVDINMPKMNGFEFSKRLERDINPGICYMSSGLINQDALREQYPTLGVGYFIKKPITVELTSNYNKCIEKLVCYLLNIRCNLSQVKYNYISSVVLNCIIKH
jgi:CheY-like chemotaxis protein